MLKVIIVGAGLAGLACAVASRQNGLEVIILERASEISSVGAGIQVPSNASRAMRHLGLLDELLKDATILDELQLRSYKTGEILTRRPLGDRSVREYGAPWVVVHRHDYHRVLLDAAIKLGVELRLGSVVQSIEFDKTEVKLENGETLGADAIIGADGLWSSTRDAIVGCASPPRETGDLAYRASFKTDELHALANPAVEALIKEKTAAAWLGPDKHCVVYPVRGGKEFNMVLLRPDNLPANMNKAIGDLGEMKATFEGWDEVLTTLISCIPSVLKWKLCYHEELKTWCKKHVVIIGDACHPTLPYQAQGAAMAVEDGVILGHLFGKLAKAESEDAAREKIGTVLQLFEALRKKRTTLNVQGAIANRKLFHMHDGPEQVERDAALKTADWETPSPWHWIDPSYQTQLLGFDVIIESDRQNDAWREKGLL